MPRDKTAYQEACALFDAIALETYYGFNLRIILAEATPEERATIATVMQRAHDERQPQAIAHRTVRFTPVR